MRVLVCGSRSWTDATKIGLKLLDVWTQNRAAATIEIIHGGAIGADTIAGVMADWFNFEARVFRPDYETHGGRRAPFMRNLAMLDEKPDVVLAFWDGESRGTAHTIEQARKRGIPVEVIEP